jgi:hypothetical protein
LGSGERQPEPAAAYSPTVYFAFCASLDVCPEQLWRRVEEEVNETKHQKDDGRP